MTIKVSAWPRHACWLALGGALLAAPASAQDTAAIGSEAEPVDEAAGVGDGAPGANVADAAGDIYEPGFFERFAPRNALDMLREIPGFSISGGGGGGGDSQRGLGQADTNVLVNGERLSSKSDDITAQLGRIPADRVARIEIVDGTRLDIPGLTGQVANVIVVGGGLSGQFEYRTQYRPRTDRFAWYGGEVSLTGSTGPLDFTLALDNPNRRFGAIGPTFVSDADGVLLETQQRESFGAFDKPVGTVNLTYDLPGSAVANLNLRYAQAWFGIDGQEKQFGPGFADRVEIRDLKETGYEYEIGADVEFALAGGRLKLIGLERFDKEDFGETVITSFADGSTATGGRFAQLTKEGERIGRAEYGFNVLDTDWQLSGEAAFNRLDNVASLFTLDAAGELQPVDFPQGSGGVTEDRYDIALSGSHQIAERLALQATLGMEFSTISQTGSAANQRSDRRPKGSASLAWKPSNTLDISGEIRRRVGQLSFGDFLARVSLDDDNGRDGNNELRPFQAWQYSVEARKTLGPWGSLTLRAEHQQFEDFVDLVPLPGGGEGRGNVDGATSSEIELEATINLKPLGIDGAQIDVEAEADFSSIEDPSTGLIREFSGARTRQFSLRYRHDIPASDWAYGWDASYTKRLPRFRQLEIGLQDEGPVFAGLFVENKDVLGTTVRFNANNLLGATERIDRTVFLTPRPDGDIAFIERGDREFGQIISLSINGNF
ncbi:hypothetical protein HME9302_00424 [Alteripontixanthobacter maritimus]|uniref:TonB-dependent receptor plug domain-containing protein n=1 Tax=Alteripontixanthobacter maritimus TaxID=2161824 RepID=A0A369Q7I0_9SPHN|nr:TonB-dependent receptor [Alteripontixanthobacter maritimus]RDC59237.1 hypothetical protein HME9302_00424 [Alteripontixanthobacter maritimus]